MYPDRKEIIDKSHKTSDGWIPNFIVSSSCKMILDFNSKIPFKQTSNICTILYLVFYGF